MTHVVVTGGGGFLGSHLCEQLLRNNYDVTCIDDFSTGRMHNLSAIRLNPRFRIVQHDITEPIPLHLSNVQQIYNLACPASPAQYQADPIRTMRINVIGALHVLDFAQRNRARVLQASTSEVYGDPTVHPQPEHYCGNVRTIGIRACYDEGKRSAETLFFDYHRQHGTSIKVARIFNTYGPRMHPDDERVVTTFLRQSLTGSPLTVHGSGTQTRSFCYVDDTIAALLLLMNGPPDVTGPINIGNPEETTVLELARAINALSGERSSIKFLPAQEDDPRQRCPDIGLAAAQLGWRPTVALADGLVRTRSHVAEMLETGGCGSVNTRTASCLDPGPARLAVNRIPGERAASAQTTTSEPGEFR